MAKRTQKQRILDRLSDGHWHSTYELAHPDNGPEVLYPVCRKEDLEKMGYVIEQRQREGSAQSEWRLVGGPAAPTLFIYTEQGWH